MGSAVWKLLTSGYLVELSATRRRDLANMLGKSAYRVRREKAVVHSGGKPRVVKELERLEMA